MLYMIGGFILFILLLFVVVVFVFKKSDTVEPAEVQVKKQSLEKLVEILKNEKKDISIINETLEKMIKNYPFPEDAKDAKDHFRFIYFYAKNPLPNAKMIVSMQKQLSENNPKHSQMIEEFQMRGVEARK